MSSVFKFKGHERDIKGTWKGHERDIKGTLKGH